MRILHLPAFILFLLVFVLGNAHPGLANSKELSLSISTDRKILKFGSDIIVKVQIDNLLDHRLKLFNTLYVMSAHMLRFEIIGPDGKSVEAIGNDIDYAYEFYRDNIITLYPGEFFGIYINLMGQAKGHERFWFVFEKKGAYRIKAFYNVPTYYSEMVKSLGGNIWMGELTSNEITVTLE